MKNIIIRCKPK